MEEVEEIRVADAAVFAGRRLHEELKQEEEEAPPPEPDGGWETETLPFEFE